MTSYLRDMDIREEGIEIGMERGLEQGLSALVNSLKDFITDEDVLYQAVIKNEAYKPDSINLSTALFPAPPTPTTLIFATPDKLFPSGIGATSGV